MSAKEIGQYVYHEIDEGIMNGTISVAAVYGVVTILSLMLAIGYLRMVKQREFWLLVVNVAVFVVNAGYFMLSVSKTLEGALAANRISYFGSVFLPLGMLMTIIRICKVKYGRVFVGIMVGISIAVFLLAASGGYLDIYYKSVTLETINGASKLVKEYGPLHCLYLFYLLGYFGAMVGVIWFSARRKDDTPHKFTTFLAAIVLGNVGIWFVEQLIRVDFEFLSVSYVITECLLLLLYGMLEDGMFTVGTESVTAEPDSENEKADYETETETVRTEQANIQSDQNIDEISVNSDDGADSDKKEVLEENNSVSEMDKRKAQFVLACPEVEFLTAREMEVFYLLLEDVKRKEIAERLGVSENTVKKHTSHIFSKLQIASRKELFKKVK